MTLDDLERHIQGLHKVFKYPLLSQERDYGLQIWPVGLHSHNPSELKPVKSLEKRERGRNHGLPIKLGRYIQRTHPNKSPFNI